MHFLSLTFLFFFNCQTNFPNLRFPKALVNSSTVYPSASIAFYPVRIDLLVWAPPWGTFWVAGLACPASWVSPLQGLWEDPVQRGQAHRWWCTWLSLSSAFLGVGSCSFQLGVGGAALEEGTSRGNHIHVPEQMLPSRHRGEIRMFILKYFPTLILKNFRCKEKLKEQYNRCLLTLYLD